MTVAVPSGGYEGLGLEDIEDSDLAIPRVKIVQDEAKFKNSLTNEERDVLDAILLAQVKQRIMWPEEMDESGKSAPMCKSVDNKQGFPNVDESAPKDKRFPWDDSNFDRDSVELHPENGLPVLDCKSCIFSQWGKDGKRPRCAEQHTYPLVMLDDEGDISSPAVLTIQGSGLKTSKNYASGFALAKEPLFFNATSIRLDPRSRGTVKYAVPLFRKGERVNDELYPELAERTRNMIAFLHRLPRNKDADEMGGLEAATEDNANEAPTPAPEPDKPKPAVSKATKPSVKATAPAPAKEPEVVEAQVVSDSDDDDDLPF